MVKFLGIHANPMKLSLAHLTCSTSDYSVLILVPLSFILTCFQ